MPAKPIDVNQHPALKGAGAGKHERLLFNSDNYHVWIHHSVPGDKGRCTDIRRIKPFMVSRGNAS
jgi:hypothetical protein